LDRSSAIISGITEVNGLDPTRADDSSTFTDRNTVDASGISDIILKASAPNRQSRPLSPPILTENFGDLQCELPTRPAARIGRGQTLGETRRYFGFIRCDHPEARPTRLRRGRILVDQLPRFGSLRCDAFGTVPTLRRSPMRRPRDDGRRGSGSYRRGRCFADTDRITRCPGPVFGNGAFD
jgi:hypothetical protein